MTTWDILPETARRHRTPRTTTGEDRGCRAAPSCLSCHLPRCIYDDPRGPRTALHAVRDAEIWRLHRSRWKAGAIAARYGLSARQVFRILSRLRAEQEAQTPPLRRHSGRKKTKKTKKTG